MPRRATPLPRRAAPLGKTPLGNALPVRLWLVVLVLLIPKLSATVRLEKQLASRWLLLEPSEGGS